MRPIRVRVHHLMIFVALAAVLLGGWVEGNRLLERRRFLMEAATHYHEQAERPSSLVPPDGPGRPREYLDAIEAHRGWLRRMAAGYRRASDRPWSSLPADLPEPRAGF